MMNKSPEKVKSSTIAVFDFDNTLTQQDSLIPFLKSISSQPSFWWGIGIKSPLIIGYLLKIIPNWQAKEAVLSYFLSGKTVHQLDQSAQNFAIETIPTLLHPKAVDRLKWHQNQGHYTVLLSASPEVYLTPWGKTMGIDRVIGTRLENKSGILTGHIEGKNCYGQEKVTRLRQELGDLDRYCIYGYGASKGDRELLSVAARAYYRKFDDTTEAEPQKNQPNWEKGLILSAIAAAVLYLGAVIWSGAEKFWTALNLLPPWLLPVMLAVVFFSYCLRFTRWHWYLNHMGYSVPWQSNLQIFLASFALTASPGKAGESIKSLLLKRRHDVPMSPTLAGLFCERFTDALSVVLLACLGLVSIMQEIQGYWAILILAGFQISFILLLQQPKLLRKYLLKPLSRISKLQKITNKLDSLINSASVLLKPKLLLGSTFIALIAWGLEGVALYYIFQYLGVESITLYQAVLIHTASGLIGALSMLPGGIGGMEAASISLSIFYGATQTQAVAATFLIRLLTLWFAIAVGIIAMVSIRTKASQLYR